MIALNHNLLVRELDQISPDSIRTAVARYISEGGDRLDKQRGKGIMQAGQATLKQYQQGTGVNLNGLTPALSTWLTRIFGCHHRELSRPFTLDHESYRVCVDCGARRKFDASRWEMVGDFYYNPPYIKVT